MTFTYPLFLIGLAAVVIPVIVHLFNFRRYKKVYFSNVERLEQMQSETRRQSTLRQLMIMAARILAIAFLVLAFARPVISDKSKALRVGSNDVSIFVDNSFSMESTDGNGLLIDKAKTKAREIVAAYGPSDRFQLITNDMEGRQFHWLNKDEVLQEIDAIEVGPASVTLPDIVRRQSDFLHGGTGKNRYAYLLSDFQTSMTRFSDFPSDSTVDVTLVPLEAASLNNVFIDSVALNAPIFHRGNRVTARVWVGNEGDEDMEKVPVTLYVNGRQRALSTVDIPAGASSLCDMHFIVDEDGILNCVVETTDYPITFDDKYFFSINVSRSINALLVEGSSPNEYLRRLFDGDSLVCLKTVDVKQMDASRLDGNNVVLLDELPTLTTGMGQSLLTFVEEGGTLVVVPAANADEKSYNEALSLFAAPQLEGWNSGRAAVVSLNEDNELYRNVFKDHTDDLEFPTLTGYHRLKWDATTNQETLLTLANGDVYISSTRCGTGHLYIIATPLRDANSDFMRQALFVPTLYNMALYSVRSTPIAATLGQEEPLMLAGDYMGDDVMAVLTKVEKDDPFEEIPDLRRVGGRTMMILHSSIKDAGNYILGKDGVAEEGLSFNYSRLESQMSFLGHDAVAKMVKDNNLDNCGVIRNVDKPFDTYLKERMQGHALWQWCLMASLLMLLVEILLIRIKN